MVLRRKVEDEENLVETYSDEDYKLKQEETGRIYGHSVIDVIAGYDEHYVPYSRYTYTETDEKDDAPQEDESEV